MRRIRTGKRVELTERDTGFIQAATAVWPHATSVPAVLPGYDRIDVMSSFERLAGKTNQEKFRKRFGELRQQVHQSMKTEEETRLRENPEPTEEEIYMGAFKEWIEPQVRDAIMTMYRKGYATQSSGFDGLKFEQQQIDGLFTVDENIKDVLNRIGVDVLRGPDIGLPKNKLVTILRFRAKDPSITKMKERWDAVAAVLPEKPFPPGIRPICDRAEEFRLQYAPEHPSLEEACDRYLEYQRTATTV